MRKRFTFLLFAFLPCVLALAGCCPASAQVGTQQILNGAVTSGKMSSVGAAGTYGDATHLPQTTYDAAGRETGVTLIPIGVGYVLGTAYQTAHMNSAGTAFVTDSGLLDDGTNGTFAGSMTSHGATIYGTALADTIAATTNFKINTSTDIIHNNYPTLTFDTGSIFTTSRFMDIVRASGYQSSDGTAGATTTMDDGSTTKNGLVVTAPNISLEGALGNPSVSGYLLSSTTAGVRSWVAPYSLPTASATVLGGVEVGSGLSITGGVLSANTQTATGTAGGDLTGTYPNPTLAAVGTAGTYGDSTHYPIVTTNSKGQVTNVTLQSVTSGGFTPSAVSAPSSVTGSIYSYSTTTAYAAFQALFTSDVSGEGGGDTEWQYSTDGSTWIGPGGTSATYYFSKGTTWLCPFGFGTGNLYARAYNVNALGSVSGAVVSSAVAYANPSTPGQVQVVNSLPTASSTNRGTIYLLNGQYTGSGTLYANYLATISTLCNEYNMYEASGTTMTDSVTSYAGNATAYPGLYGGGSMAYHQPSAILDTGAYSVKSTGQLSTVTNGSTRQATSVIGCSVNVWINFNSQSSNTVPVYIGAASGNGLSVTFTVTSSVASIMASWRQGSGNTATSAYTVATSSVWHMCTATADGTNLKIYVDGTLRQTLAYTNDTTTTASLVYVGYQSSASATTGYANLGLFASPLTATVISGLYNAGTGGAANDTLYISIELANGTYTMQNIALP